MYSWNTCNMSWIQMALARILIMNLLKKRVFSYLLESRARPQQTLQARMTRGIGKHRLLIPGGWFHWQKKLVNKFVHNNNLLPSLILRAIKKKSCVVAVKNRVALCVAVKIVRWANEILSIFLLVNIASWIYGSMESFYFYMGCCNIWKVCISGKKKTGVSFKLTHMRAASWPLDESRRQGDGRGSIINGHDVVAHEKAKRLYPRSYAVTYWTHTWEWVGVFRSTST